MDLTLRPNAEPIPGYRLLERIGRGGYGEVWKAEAPGGMHKAIKFVFGNMDTAGEDSRAAEQEYKSLNRVKTIRHPFLLSLERIEVIDGQLVIVMELADRNLFDRYQECINGNLSGVPRSELLGYLEEAAEALDLMNLHHQIQHLDIKPQNLFLVHQHVKVADFGLAKDLEGAKAVVTGGMTPMYAPPETFEGWVSRQSDQYSLAIVYMEMLTGQRPFHGPGTKQLILQHLTAAPDLSPLGSPDREAVARALAKNPDDRFATCKDFVRALKEDSTPRNPIVTGTDTPTRYSEQARETVSPAPDTPERRSTDVRKTLPALVTRGSKIAHAAVLSTPRPRTPTAEPNKPRAVVERTGNGALFPALVVGIGGTGQAVLRSLRQLLMDQFQKPTLPNLRWLFIDVDPTSVESMLAPTDPTSLSQDEVLITRLRRPAHYLSRDGLPPVDSWLPPGDLYRMPRTGTTDGIRVFGRLALCDHYQILVQRLRAALEPFQRPDPVLETDRITGLGIRSTFPRVYLATSLSGGAGSGMFLDLAYLLRREIRQLGFGEPHVVGLLGVPPCTADSRASRGVANSRAALTELTHYGRPGAPYKAQFDTRESPVVDSEPAFRRCALIRLPSRYDRGDQPGDIGGHLAYLDMFTPLGRVAHPDDRTSPGPLSLSGIRRLSWPRSHVLRAASWLLAKQTLQSWYAPTPPAAGTVAAAIEVRWNERDLDRPALRAALEEQLVARFGGTAEYIATHALEAADGISGSGSLSARAGFSRLVELVGRSGAEDSENPGEVTRALMEKVKSLARSADAKLATTVTSLIEQPGLRLAGAEEAVRLLHGRLQQELSVADRHSALALDRAVRDSAPVLTQLASLSANPTAVADREFLELLYRWAVSRIEALIARAVANVYRILVGNIPEYGRELNGLQTQLQSYVKQLEEAPPRILPSTGVCRPIFPDGAGSVTEAAARLVGSLEPKDLKEFENGLQARIRHEIRGVVHVCARMRENGAAFQSLILDQSMKFLERRVPHMPVTGALQFQYPTPDALSEKVREFVASSGPVSVGTEPAPPPTLSLLGIPEDDASDRLAHIARKAFPGLAFRSVKTVEDVYFVQEVQGVSAAALPHLSSELSAPPPEESELPATSHARADIHWVAVGAE